MGVVVVVVIKKKFFKRFILWIEFLQVLQRCKSLYAVCCFASEQSIVDALVCCHYDGSVAVLRR